MKKEQRTICVLYITATCNLKCKYCYIDKSPVLSKIDHLLEESFKGDYYFNFMKDMFDQSKLTELEFWGGEPSYGLKRAIPTVKKAIEYFPNLTHFMMSSNLTTETCVDDLFNFWSIFKNYPYRKFHFTLQLSIDGPTYINDFNRGEKTTELFTKNFAKLVYKLNNFLKDTPNLSIEACFKETLDNYAISQLQTKESIIHYYQFLDEYQKIVDKFLGDCNNFKMHTGVPNTATPSPHTSKDGELFYNFCRLINEITEENKTKHYFYSYQNIMPFTRGALNDSNSLCHGCLTCGTGSIILGLLPNRLISGCHNGFVELLTEYKQHQNVDSDQIDKIFFTYNNANQNNIIFTEDQYKIYERQVNAFCPESNFQISELSTVIRQVALAGQIDEKYKDIEEAIKGAHFIQSVTASCLRDNLQVTGSKYLFQLGYIRLFLNGAKEEIQKNAEKF